MSTDEIRMEMRLDHILDSQALFFCFLYVLVDVTLGINDSALTFGAYEVRRMSKTPQVELFKEHRSPRVLVEVTISPCQVRRNARTAENPGHTGMSSGSFNALVSLSTRSGKPYVIT